MHVSYERQTIIFCESLTNCKGQTAIQNEKKGNKAFVVIGLEDGECIVEDGMSGMR